VGTERAAQLDLAEGVGLEVHGVEPGSLAQRMGVEVGDILITINGEKIGGVEDVGNALRTAGPSDEIRVDVIRGEEGKKSLKAPKQGTLRLRRRV
jgi:serine protease Do